MLSDEDLARRESSKLELATRIHIEEISRRQKSRVQWVKEGDLNTRFFHSMANYHRRNYYVETLEIGDKTMEANEQLR